MNRRFSSSEAFQALRKKAEGLLKKKGSERPDIDEEDLLHLTHELEVYQVELELQNEELRRAKVELESSRNEFSDLYEFAPVPYVALNEEGAIQRANKAAIRMLGVRRKVARGVNFGLWVPASDKGVV